MMFNKISATVLIVQKYEACRTFYEDVLGLEILFQDDDSVGYKMADHDFLLLKINAAAQMVGDDVLSSENDAVHRVLLCVGVDDVDATYNTYTAKGVTFIKPPKSQDWGRRTAYFTDPDGNLWEIWHELPDDHQ